MLRLQCKSYKKFCKFDYFIQEYDEVIKTFFLKFCSRHELTPHKISS